MLRLTQWLSRKTTTIHNPFSYFYLLWGLYTFNCLKPHNTMFGFTTEIGLCLVPTNDGCTLTLTKKNSIFAASSTTNDGPGDRWIPRTNGQWRGKCFHLMTSSCMSRRMADILRIQSNPHEVHLTDRSLWGCKGPWRELPHNNAGLILGSHPVNENRRHFETTSLIGWAQA